MQLAYITWIDNGPPNVGVCHDEVLVEGLSDVGWDGCRVLILEDPDQFLRVFVDRVERGGVVDEGVGVDGDHQVGVSDPGVVERPHPLRLASRHAVHVTSVHPSNQHTILMTSIWTQNFSYYSRQ